MNMSGSKKPGLAGAVSGSGERLSSNDGGSLAAAIYKATGVDVAKCYQCGKCTAGCPMAGYMDLSVNQVMRLAQIGDSASSEELLHSAALWHCAGCLTCTQRCPRELDPAAVMDVLREMAYCQGRAPDEAKRIRAFHEAFLKNVECDGRMGEIPLVVRYKLLSRDFFSDVTLAPRMLAKGKLPLRPHRIQGRAEIRRIFAACRRRKS